MLFRFISYSFAISYLWTQKPFKAYEKTTDPPIAAFAANTVSAAAPQQVIDISTDKVSMVLTAAPGGEVYFRHFGGRIDDPAPLADYKMQPPQ